MKELLARWRRCVDGASAKLNDVPDEAAQRRPAPGKWSTKEIIGHLIDSATNNQRRFVEAQRTPDLVFPGYAQDDWVRLQRYQEAPWPEIVHTWTALNHHLIRIVALIPGEALERPRSVHNLDEIGWKPVAQARAATLDQLVRDYVGHLEHHLRQVDSIDG